MKLELELKEVHGAVSLCIKCAGCTYAEWPDPYTLCPTYARDECFTFSAGGLLYVVKALIDNKIEYSQPIAELLATCTGCGACDSRCGIIRSQTPFVNPLDIIRIARYESVKRGFIPQGYAQKIAIEVKKTGDFGHPNNFQIPETIKSAKADAIIFAECFHTSAQDQIAEATARVLEKIGEPVSVFSNKGCCGSTLYDYGFWDQLKPLVRAQWEAMNKLNNKTFVFLDPHCQEFIRKRYPEILSDYKPVKTQHISQILAAAFQEDKLKSKKSSTLKVSYHDPCFLGRGLGIYDAPRKVLYALSGVKLIEMDRNKQNSFCCGARAVGNYMPQMAKWTARERIKEFQATGAELLITACPYCKTIFQEVLPEKDRAKVKDLVELVDERT
jgi:heterodisulfide reductase subunit D